jgi:acetate kinase
MTDAILVLNPGSSSLKFAVFEGVEDSAVALLRGKIAGIGTKPAFSAKDGVGLVLPQGSFPPMDAAIGLDDLIPMLLHWLNDHRNGITIKGVGHHVVHGGLHHVGPARVTGALMTDLKTLVPLTPMHQPHNLAAIRHAAASDPDLPQVACIDTSFHRTQDRLAQLFALPRQLTDDGIIRHGFHGLSYEYIASNLPRHLGPKANVRVIVAHLGGGASMCALKKRRSVATSMGFTALDGLMMGRRCGALDPGVVLYLMQAKGLSSQKITEMLYEQSGLLGVSGISNDMGTLQASNAPEARQAIDLFCFCAARELAALATTIGRLDAVIFTAGIGENSALVRKCICNRLNWMGVALDPAANDANATRITANGSDIDVLVISTDEEAVIARATHDMILRTRRMT